MYITRIFILCTYVGMLEECKGSLRCHKSLTTHAIAIHALCIPSWCTVSLFGLVSVADLGFAKGGFY